MSEDPSGSPAGDNTHAPESVTVVVCAYTLDRWTDLHDGVLEAAHQLRESGREGRVLVVVDHNDELLTKAGELAGPLVDVIANTQNTTYLWNSDSYPSSNRLLTPKRFRAQEPVDCGNL